MRFRAALTITWTAVLMWQLTRVLGDEAAWGSLVAPVLGTGGSVALFARWASGSYLLLVIVLAPVFPLALIAVFTLGAWLSGAPVPALPSLWFAQAHPFVWGRALLFGFIMFVGLHMLALYETAEGEGDILRKP